MTFRLLAGLTGWLEHLLQSWSRDAAGEATPEFGWEAPDDWLRRATPQPPEDWVERVRTVMPEWEPPEPAQMSRLPRLQAEAGEPSGPGRVPVTEYEPKAPVRLPPGSKHAVEPERIRFGKGAPLSPQALPVETRHSDEHVPEPARLAPGYRIDEAEPQRIVLAPAEPPKAGEVIARKTEPAVDPASDINERSSDRPVPPETQLAKMVRRAARSEIAAGQVTYGKQQWPEVEPVMAQPRQRPDAERIEYRQTRRELAADVNKEMSFVQDALPAAQELLWIEEDRWPALPESQGERDKLQDDPARRARLDGEQEGKDAWTA
jgi:hypothetical protein